MLYFSILLEGLLELRIRVLICQWLLVARFELDLVFFMVELMGIVVARGVLH